MPPNVLLTTLLIPPANLLPIAVVGLLLARWWPRFGRTVAGVALLLLLVLGMPVTSLLLIDTLQIGIPLLPPAAPHERPEAAAEAPAEARPGAIIVLSADGGSSGEGGILPRQGVGMMTLERLHAGAILSRRLALPLLVSGGVLEKGAPPIAIRMARVLQQDFGVTAAWIEPRSADTWENAAFSAEILRNAGIRSAYVVTNAWHMRRALIAFRHFDIEAIPAASRFEPEPDWDLSEIFPRVTAWQRSYFAIHEWVGCAYYALRR